MKNLRGQLTGRYLIDLSGSCRGTPTTTEKYFRVRSNRAFHRTCVAKIFSREARTAELFDCSSQSLHAMAATNQREAISNRGRIARSNPSRRTKGGRCDDGLASPAWTDCGRYLADPAGRASNTIKAVPVHVATSTVADAVSPIADATTAVSRRMWPVTLQMLSATVQELSATVQMFSATVRMLPVTLRMSSVAVPMSSVTRRMSPVHAAVLAVHELKNGVALRTTPRSAAGGS